MTGAAFLQCTPYQPPQWAECLKLKPSHRYHLGCLPTPIHRWHVPGVPEGTRLWIKRDDLSGMQLSGNKVRKLEFLMAEALAQAADCVLTIGGIQSNHARATAVAARYLGLPAHLILRTSRAAVEEDPGLTGNLLLERLAGATLHLVTKEEYTQHGSEALGTALAAQLEGAGARPYVIPVGGSNSLGCWGYLEAVEEMRRQAAELGVTFHTIAMACGSGGTTAGLALGAHLAGLGTAVRAYGVCDTPDYFYDFIDGLYGGLGWAGASARETLTAVQARGAGYAISTEQELAVVQGVAAATGVVLDPVYSGKALAGLLADMAAAPGEWAGRDVLFIHTGGLLGMYDKVDQLQPLVAAANPVQRLKMPA